MTYLIYMFFIFSLSYSQIYTVGEQISTNHQNQSHSVCYGETDAGDRWVPAKIFQIKFGGVGFGKMKREDGLPD